MANHSAPDMYAPDSSMAIDATYQDGNAGSKTEIVLNCGFSTLPGQPEKVDTNKFLSR